MVEYNSYKKSSYDWLGKIPSHWEEKFLEQTASEKCIKNVSNSVIQVLSLSYGEIIKKNDLNKGLIAQDLSTYQVIRPGDIIMRLTDLQNDHRSLRTGLVKDEGIITSAYLCLVPRIDSEYLHYLLHAYDVQKVFYGMGGGVRQSIGFKDIRHMYVPVPPRAEQDQIVRFLDWKVSKANTLINIKKKEIKSVESLKHSAVSDAVTHGLTADIPMKYSGVKWLGDIPAHWTTIKLRQLLSSVSEKNHPELPLLSVVREQGVIVRDVDDKEANHNYIPDDLSGYKMVKKGQFVMNKMKAWQGSYGISDYTGIVSPAYFIFDVAFDNLEYFHYAIRSKVYVNFFAQASDGIRVGQWDLQMDKMKEIPFIVPPADEQIAIVEHIKKTLPKYDEAIEKIKAEVAVLEEYKAKLIADIVTGKIDVRNITVPEYEHVDDIVDDDLENNEETEIDGEEA
ncbi:type I restriction endonuclease subunit S [Lactobacillus delbrueckii]|uniref:restriction endonuclease subunit S n=1 Tax=Lactobacillus delbrueckii TaxID=1584 RepID=UPI001F2E9BD1|nr:restriction endonuclease subunit S [Lactobacillus delbrueckii]GHN49734.1 type I restriction endonuclease subunit S [Lactobacillus delbrueckii]